MTVQTENTLTPVGELAQTLLQFDFFHVHKTIDKQVIFNALKEAFHRGGVSLEVFLQKAEGGQFFFWESHELERVQPIYVPLWAAAAGSPYDSLVVAEKRDEKFVQRTGQRAVFNFDEINKFILSRAEKNMRIAPRMRPSVLSYMEQAAMLLKCFTYKMDETNITRGRYVIEPLVELLKNGYGIPYVVGRQDTVRVEARIPVWDIRAVPEIIECAEAPWLEIAVIQGSVFLPEKVWRYPENLSVEDVLNEPNMEVRRVMLERFGNEKFIQQAKLTLVDERDGLKLYAVRLGWRMEFNLVQCVCPTSLRVYYLRVPPDITDANTAIAWTFGETGESYRVVDET